MLLSYAGRHELHSYMSWFKNCFVKSYFVPTCLIIIHYLTATRHSKLDIRQFSYENARIIYSKSNRIMRSVKKTAFYNQGISCISKLFPQKYKLNRVIVSFQTGCSFVQGYDYTKSFDPHQYSITNIHKCWIISPTIYI